MQYTKRKTNVRQHVRHNGNKVSNVTNHQRNVKAKQQLGVIALNNMNYKEAKKSFPGLKPYGDIDGDGVINKKDCHPFDTSRQDDEQSYEGTDEQQREADENLSNLLAKQRQEERGNWV